MPAVHVQAKAERPSHQVVLRYVKVQILHHLLVKVNGGPRELIFFNIAVRNAVTVVPWIQVN